MNQYPQVRRTAEGSLVRLLLLALVIPMTGATLASAQRAGVPAEVLTNQTVIDMATAKINKDLLAAKIANTRNTFDVSVNGLVGLHQSKVPQDAMISMISVADDPKLGRPAASASEVLDNRSIVSLSVAKVPKGVILAKIRKAKSAFDVSANGLVGLTQAKVNTDVIKAMITKAGGA